MGKQECCVACLVMSNVGLRGTVPWYHGISGEWIVSAVGK